MPREPSLPIPPWSPWSGSSVGRLFAELGAEPVVAEAWSSLRRRRPPVHAGPRPADRRRGRRSTSSSSTAGTTAAPASWSSCRRSSSACSTPPSPRGWRCGGRRRRRATRPSSTRSRRPAVEIVADAPGAGASRRPRCAWSRSRRRHRSSARVTALAVFALLGVAVDGVVVNRFPRKADGWPKEAMDAAEQALDRHGREGGRCRGLEVHLARAGGPEGAFGAGAARPGAGPRRRAADRASRRGRVPPRPAPGIGGAGRGGRRRAGASSRGRVRRGHEVDRPAARAAPLPAGPGVAHPDGAVGDRSCPTRPPGASRRWPREQRPSRALVVLRRGRASRIRAVPATEPEPAAPRQRRPRTLPTRRAPTTRRTVRRHRWTGRPSSPGRRGWSTGPPSG